MAFENVKAGGLTDYAFDGVAAVANQKGERKYLVTAINCGDSINETSGTPVWEIVGAGVEDSSIEYSPDKETVTDILGITETTVNKLELSQSLDPMTIRGGQKLSFKLLDIVSRNAVSELSNFEVMQIWAFISDKSGTPEVTKLYAEVHKNCTITPESLGGSSYIDMPITIDFSNDKVLGTVKQIQKSR